MKISLFFRSYNIKAYCLFILISILVTTPTQTNAGFINDFIATVIGSSVQADENVDNFGTDDFINSQTMQVLGTSSIDPDTKNVNNASMVTIMDDGVLSTDIGFIGSGLESVSTGEMTVYEVEEGDTLSEIAELYDISVNTIKWENNITGNSIKVGRKLNILPVTGVKHIIKSGDTLDKIANKYDAEIEDIMVFNDVTKSTSLKQGEIIYVPNGIIAAAVIQKSSTKTSSVSSTSSSKIESGYYTRPAAGRITSPYGARKLGYHYGIDIGNARGTTIIAAASGVVVNSVSYCKEGNSSCGGRYGNYITIEHSNGQRTRYAHMQKVSVSVGDRVSKGEKIGTIGNTGRSTGPHLHFEIEKANGSKMKPPF